MFNRLRGLFQPNTPKRDGDSRAPSGTRYLLTRGSELIGSDTRSGGIDAAILRSIGGQASLDPSTLSRVVATSATAFACIEYRANTISDIPLYPALESGDRVDPVLSPFGFFLRRAPLLLGNASRSADIWGRVFFRKRYNPKQFPTGLEWVNPVNVIEVGQPQVTEYRVFNENTWRQDRVRLEDMIVAQTFDSRPHGTGISRLEAAYRLVGLDFGTVTHALAFMTNSARIDGMLTFDNELSPDELEAAREQWRVFKGANNAHKTAVMPGGARWTPVQATPKDLMMSETKKDVRAEIAVIFQVDLGLLGLEGTADPLSANSTYGAKQVNFVRTAVLPFLRTVLLPALNEQWAARDFGQPYEIKADESKIPALAEAHLTKATTANDVRTSSLYTHNEARLLVGMEAQDDYLKRAPDEPLKLWQGGGITLNLFHEYTLGRAMLGADGEVVLLNGVLIPVTRIMELANANVDRMKTPLPFSPFGAPTPPPIPVTAPETPLLPAPEAQRDIGEPLFVGLDLANNADLIGLWRQLKQNYPHVKWSDPKDFHITLLYAPTCDPQKARAFVASLRFVEPPELTLKIGSLKSFDSIGKHALHFRIGQNLDLLDFQDSIYQLALDCGIEASSYSAPQQYIPHITMGYAPEKTTVIWSSKLVVTPRGLMCDHGEMHLFDTSADATPALPAPADELATARAAQQPLEFALSFAGNANVKAARRELSTHLTANGLVNPAWVSEQDWKLTLFAFDQWSPAEAAKLVRMADYADTRKLDLQAIGYGEYGGVLYLRVQESEALDALRTSIALDMEGVGMTPSIPPLVGIPLCAYTDSGAGSPAPILPVGAPQTGYPLVGAALTLYKGSTAQHTWTLRGISKAQDTELYQWERAVTRKGRGYNFTSRSIHGLIDAYIRLSLEDEDVEPDAVFSEARAWLVRNYRETRISYQDEIRAAIERARADAVSARKFDGEMNSIVRRFGLQTVYDAYTDGGNPIESLSQDDLTLFRAWQQETKDYIRNFKNELFKEGGISAAEVEVRVALWANKTLDDLFYTMLRQAAPQLEVTWYRNPDAESCPDCLERDRRTLTLDEWGKIGFPRDRRLSCGGWQCACILRDKDGKTYRSHSHDDAPITRAIAALGLEVFTRTYHVHHETEDAHDQSDSDHQHQAVRQHQETGGQFPDADEERSQDSRAARTGGIDEATDAGDPFAETPVYLELRSGEATPGAALVVQGGEGGVSADSERTLREDGTAAQIVEAD